MKNNGNTMMGVWFLNPLVMKPKVWPQWRKSYQDKIAQVKREAGNKSAYHRNHVPKNKNQAFKSILTARMQTHHMNLENNQQQK